MRDPADITPLQAKILEAIWIQGRATAADVRRRISLEADRARTTVATMLARMERYGWLTRVRDGREFTYQATLTRSQVRGFQMRCMIDALFPKDLPSLVSHALREGEWDEGDLDRIEDMVRRHRGHADAGRQAG